MSEQPQEIEEQPALDDTHDADAQVGDFVEPEHDVDIDELPEDGDEDGDV